MTAKQVNTFRSQQYLLDVRATQPHNSVIKMSFLYTQSAMWGAAAGVTKTTNKNSVYCNPRWKDIHNSKKTVVEAPVSVEVNE